MCFIEKSPTGQMATASEPQRSAMHELVGSTEFVEPRQAPRVLQWLLDG